MRPATPAGRTAALAVAIAVLSLSGPGAQTVTAPAGPVIRLAYRSLQPGEPVLVYLESDSTVKSATVTFLGRTAELKPTRSSRTTRLSRTPRKFEPA